VLADYDWMKDKLSRTPLKRVAAGPLGYGLAAATRSLPRELFRGATRCRIVNAGDEAYQVGAKGSLVRRPIARGEVLYDGPMRFAAMSTIPYYGYGFRMFPYADERPDRMHLRLTTMSPLEFLFHMRDIWRGSYETSKSVFDFLVERVSIDVEPEVAFQIGGDSQGNRSHVEVHLSPTPIELVDMYAPPSIAP
jgi:diacylglycerol kinase family enzyme